MTMSLCTNADSVNLAFIDTVLVVNAFNKALYFEYVFTNNGLNHVWRTMGQRNLVLSELSTLNILLISGISDTLHIQ